MVSRKRAGQRIEAVFAVLQITAGPAENRLVEVRAFAHPQPGPMAAQQLSKGLKCGGPVNEPALLVAKRPFRAEQRHRDCVGEHLQRDTWVASHVGGVQRPSDFGEQPAESRPFVYALRFEECWPGRVGEHTLPSIHPGHRRLGAALRCGDKRGIDRSKDILTKAVEPFEDALGATRLAAKLHQPRSVISNLKGTKSCRVTAAPREVDSGDYYHAESIASDNPTWQHAVMAELLPALANRRASRAFSPRAVEESAQELLWRAVSVAPSHGNAQPTRIVVARSADARTALLAAISDGNRNWAPAAPLLFVLCANPYNDFSLTNSDGSVRELYALHVGIALGTLLAQATEIGLIAHPMAGFDERAVRAALGIPQEVRVLCVVAAGYAGDAVSLPADLAARETRDQERIPIENLVSHDGWDDRQGPSAREISKRAK